MPVLLSVQKQVVPQAFWQGNTTEKIIALTFDDGPGPDTDQLLTLLKSENVSATFFVLGTRAPRYPRTVRRLVREGHLLALHGMEHVSLHGRSTAWLEQNIQKEQTLLRSLIGSLNPPKQWYFRPPFGALSPRIVRTIERTGTRLVMCTTLPGQQHLWPQQWTETPTVTRSRVLRDLEPGAVIALHDGEDIGQNDSVFSQPHVVETTRGLIHALKQKGYRFVRLDQMPDPRRP